MASDDLANRLLDGNDCVGAGIVSITAKSDSLLETASSLPLTATPPLRTNRAVADLSAGAKSISELLLEHGIATGAFLELAPRPPVVEAFRKFAQPELYLIHGNDPCNSRSVDSATLLTGTICERCGSVSGVRTDVPLRLDCPVSGDGGVTADKTHSYHLVSGEFLKQLSIEERARLEFREIQKPGRRPFFEIVGPPGVPTVAIY